MVNTALTNSTKRVTFSGMHWFAASLALVVSVVAFSRAADPARDVDGMRARIDRRLADHWLTADIVPAEDCTDSEFLRRAYLDLIGRIPRVSEVREFFSDQRLDRRQHLIEQLVQRPGYATRLANAWRRFLLPEGTDLERFGGIAGFETWLRAQFAQNTPYDQLVRDLLMAEGNASQSGPALFFTAWELKTEKLAASTSRAFLGLQLQCAECHDHPFDNWTQRDFWGYAAFFARLKSDRNVAPGQIVSFRERDTGEATLPDTEEVVMPRHLGGHRVEALGPGSP